MVQYNLNKTVLKIRYRDSAVSPPPLGAVRLPVVQTANLAGNKSKLRQFLEQRRKIWYSGVFEVADCESGLIILKSPPPPI